ncbi:MAG TPA: glycosyltransferase [Gemmatimonadaceae bacterium]|nr:glycosyltransferase [Gemmatimonadaceae bacterium]
MKRDGRLRIGMLGLYGMPLPQLHFTGFETAFGEIAPRLVAAGHEVTIYCRGSHYPQALRVDEFEGVRLKYVPSPGGKNLSGLIATLVASLHALVFGRYDVFFFVNVGMGHHAALCRILGATVVMNVDGLDWKRAKWGPIARAYFLSAAHSAIRFCNRLVTDAEAMRRIYLEEFKTETTMIAYGAYVESSEQPNKVRQFGVEPNEYYLIASRLIPENHPDLIIEGFLASRTSRKLVIAGGANYDSPFHRRLKELATDRVVFTGHIHDQSVIKELHCNCFAYVHGHSVGGTNPSLLKAMGYGNCILALDTVFNREVLADAGLFFQKDTGSLAGLIKSIESEPALVRELRLRGPKRVREHYSWDHVSEQYDRLFRDVAGQR